MDSAAGKLVKTYEAVGKEVAADGVDDVSDMSKYRKILL